jgi:formylglycine-generating enzyme required for sulfatase activity
MSEGVVDPLGPEAYRRIARMLAAETSDFNELVRQAGLDPAKDFRHADLAGSCMAGADLCGFDFSFSDFRNVDLTNASIAGARFGRADLAGTDLTKARGLGDASLALAVIQDAPFAPQLVVIPAGSFVMGSPEDEEGRDEGEGPQHRVTFAAPFALGKYPVTFEEYDHFCVEIGREQPSDQGWGRGRRPVINVSWEDAKAYCAWLGDQTGQAYRLPSEAEWEYACRAGTTSPFWTGETIGTEQANYDGNYTYGSGREGEYREQTTPVDAFAANPWGLHDMHGNVWEWCEDRWHDSYEGAPDEGSAWLQGKSSGRVVRGGSWYVDPGLLRSAYRFGIEPVLRINNLGFRVSRMLTP